MTKKLYYESPYIREFYADIVETLKKDGKYHIVLDRTAFFPEGGGQPCDLGEIGGMPVIYTYEEQEKVYHITEDLPPKQQGLLCSIDWERRFDHMQQHLGQHILSALIQDQYGAETVGFHMGCEKVTVDIDRALKESDLRSVEYLTNKKVFENLEVETKQLSIHEIEGLKLRKPPQVEDNIRIVAIKDTDFTPCCGTHPNRTGDIGLVKIIKWEKYKGGLRIEFVCGTRALEDYFWKNDAIISIAGSLSIKDTDVRKKTGEMAAELNSLRKENKLLQECILEIEAEELLKNPLEKKNIRIIKAVYEGRSLGQLKIIASKLTLQPGVVAILGLKERENAHIILNRSKELIQVNIEGVFKEIIKLIDGKGGGSSISLQGCGNRPGKLDAALEEGLKRIEEQLL